MLPERYSPQDLLKVQMAYWLAKDGHRTQSREGGERYFEHPRDVAILCLQAGFDDPDTIAAALLHDGVEDTYIPLQVYLALVGRAVWKGVSGLSKKIPQFDPVTGQVTGYVVKDMEAYFAEIMVLPPKLRVVKVLDRHHNNKTAHRFAAGRLRRYIDESRDRILPIAQATEMALARLIEEDIDRLEAVLQSR